MSIMQQPPAHPSPGDKVPNFTLPDAEGTLRIFHNEVTGRPALLVAFSDLRDPQQAAALDALAARADAIADAGAEIFVASGPGPIGQNAAKGRFMLFFDGKGAILPRLLAAEPASFPETRPFVPTIASYVLDPNQRVLAAFRRQPPQVQLDKAMEALRACSKQPEPAMVLQQGAPVLILPNVLEPAFCQRLIDLWHRGGHQEGSVSDGKRNVYAPGTKKNQEHLIKDPELSQSISFKLAQRIGPELVKVFNYTTPFRFEGHIVLCYQDDRQDFFGLHRDIHREESPRRFAASTNLNDGFEGGALYFPEYGPHGYKPPAGGSAVFSCSLLHEARPVTRGTRFALTSFFCLADQPVGKYPAERRRQMEV